MKKVEHYICDYCGTEYKDEKSCKECEKGHKIPVSIERETYNSIRNDRSGYPKRIYVKMNDSEIVIYKRY